MVFAYLECRQGSSSKFWEIDVDGASTTTRYGRIGSAGTSKTADHGDAAKAAAYALKTAQAKRKKGYKDAAPAASAGAGAGAGAGSSAAAKPKKKSKGSTAAAATTPHAYLECTAGGSSKFWQVVVEGDEDGATTRVTYGKIGSGGSTQVKEYDSLEAANKAVGKLVKQKVGKGYKHADTSTAAPDQAAPAGKRKRASRAPAAASKRGKGKTTGASASGHGLDGCVICLTGTCSMARKDMVALIEGAGGVFAKSVTAKATHLLLAPGGEDTTKHAQALGRGLEIVDEAWVVARASGGGDASDAGKATGKAKAVAFEPHPHAHRVAMCRKVQTEHYKRCVGHRSVSAELTSDANTLIVGVEYPPEGEPDGAVVHVSLCVCTEEDDTPLTLVREYDTRAEGISAAWAFTQAQIAKGYAADDGDTELTSPDAAPDSQTAAKAIDWDPSTGPHPDCVVFNHRLALIPVLQDGDPGLLDDKYGGVPYMEPTDEWPVDEEGEPMAFIFQCNLTNLPRQHEECGDGLLQMFSILEVEPYPADEMFGVFFRIVKMPRDDVRKEHVEVPEQAAEWSREIVPKAIVGWKERMDPPGDEDDVLGAMPPALALYMENRAYELESPYGGDKMFGSSDFVHGWPGLTCSQCEQELHPLFQTNGHLVGKEFADKWALASGYGAGYLLQCATHKDELQFQIDEP